MGAVLFKAVSVLLARFSILVEAGGKELQQRFCIAGDSFEIVVGRRGGRAMF